MALKIDEHGLTEAVLKKSGNVLEREHHLLVQLDRNFESHRVDDANESRLTGRIESQIVVSEVNSLKYCLIHTVGLDRELEDGEDGFLAELVRDLVSKVLT